MNKKNTLTLILLVLIISNPAFAQVAGVQMANRFVDTIFSVAKVICVSGFAFAGIVYFFNVQKATKLAIAAAGFTAIVYSVGPILKVITFITGS